MDAPLSDLLAPGEHGDSTPPPPAALDHLEPEQRVSFYVQAVDEMIDAVLEHEGFLFDPVELDALNRFRSLPCKSLVHTLASNKGGCDTRSFRLTLLRLCRPIAVPLFASPPPKTCLDPPLFDPQLDVVQA